MLFEKEISMLAGAKEAMTAVYLSLSTDKWQKLESMDGQKMNVLATSIRVLKKCIKCTDSIITALKLIDTELKMIYYQK